MKTNVKSLKKEVRHKRIRAKVKGTEERPRLSVFKSNKFIYAQIINDDKRITLASASSSKMKSKGIDAAKEVGAEIAKKAKAANISKVVFDRGGFIYTGQIKTLAEAAREAGLTF